MPSRAYVSAFGFKGPDQQKPAGVLSGGERNRLNLALTLKQGGNLLLLDEPTNDLDVETLGSLENALLEFPGCAVVISHDRWFLDRVATHILAYEGTEEDPAKWYWFEGNFESLREEQDRAPRRGRRPPAPGHLPQAHPRLGGVTGVTPIRSDPAPIRDAARSEPRFGTGRCFAEGRSPVPMGAEGAPGHGPAPGLAEPRCRPAAVGYPPRTRCADRVEGSRPRNVPLGGGGRYVAPLLPVGWFAGSSAGHDRPGGQRYGPAASWPGTSAPAAPAARTGRPRTSTAA